MIPFQIKFSRDFVKDVRQLRKRYPRIEEDIDSLLADMEDTGYRGERLTDIGDVLYKVRLTNRSARRGKSGGFRALYLLEQDQSFVFIHIYSKTDKNDVSASEIRTMLRNLE